MNKKNIPHHVGLIIDGNRRWARERNLPTLEGHLKGRKKMQKAPEWFFNRGVKIVSVYVFSTKNWNRSREEVNYLMKLLKKAISDDFKALQEKNYKITISGKLKELPGDLPEECAKLIKETKDNTRGILNICLNYGGRDEIIGAIKKIVENKINPEDINEKLVEKYLYNGELGDPDIIVRTSGERRLSDFQLWQSAYSELLFMEKYWPDFEEEDVKFILEEYMGRKRRFGGDGDSSQKS